MAIIQYKHIQQKQAANRINSLLSRAPKERDITWHIVCKNNLRFSMQARASSYCWPREDNHRRYTMVELGFFNRDPGKTINFEPGEYSPNAVAPFVHVSIITKLIEDNGGFKGFVFPG